jgi:hypothetical protein
MAEQYEITFEWLHTEPNAVIVTGSFDQWSSSIQMKKDANGFKGTTKIPWGEKIAYKFIVDGQWVVNDREPTETDNLGNVNNVYTAPKKPSNEFQPNGNGTVVHGLESAAHGKPTTQADAFHLPQLVSELATTMAATDGTTSAFGYVASGVGAAMRSVIGVDPINPDPLSAPPTAEVNGSFTQEPSPATPVPAGKENGAPATETTKVTESTPAVAPMVEPSTHTPVTPAVVSPSEPSVDTLPAALSTELPPSNTSIPAEVSTHIPMVVPVTFPVDPSVDTLPVVDAVASEPTPTASPAAPTVEASTHAPIIAVSSKPTPSGNSISLATPAVETSTHAPVTSVVEPSVDILPITTPESAATPEPEASLAMSEVPELTTEADSGEALSSPTPDPATETKVDSEIESTPATTIETVQSAEPVAPVSVPVVTEPTSTTSASDTNAVVHAEAVTAPTADVTEEGSKDGDGEASASRTEDQSATPRASTTAPSVPSTPTKKDTQSFPSSSRSSTPTSSPSSSKFGTTSSSRTKRKSIFGKMNLKKIFGKDKEKEK